MKKMNSFKTFPARGGLGWGYIRLAIRSILSFRMYSGVNLLGLALSLACVITIFRYVYGEITVDRFNDNLDRMYVTTISCFHCRKSISIKALPIITSGRGISIMCGY